MALVCCAGTAHSAGAAESLTAQACGSFVSVGALGYGNDYPTGWMTSAGVSSERIGLIGEFGGSYHSIANRSGAGPNLEASQYNFMGGPKIILAHRTRTVTVFAQVLLGGVRLGNNYGGHQTSFAWQAGGGLDVGLTRLTSVRVQGDFRFIQPGGGTMKEFRAAVGLVFHTP